MGEPYEDDTCMNCGGYNNEWVICNKCLKQILKELGVSDYKIKYTMERITRYEQ